MRVTQLVSLIFVEKVYQAPIFALRGKAMRRDKPTAHPTATGRDSGRRHRAANAAGIDSATSDLAPAMVDALSDILREENRGGGQRVA